MSPIRTSRLGCYLSKIVFYIPLFSLLATFLGCAPIAIKDSLPIDNRKGYVEFYFLKSEGDPGYRALIYRIEGNNKVLEGKTSIWAFQEKIGFRLAKPPGIYNFLISLGNAEKVAVVAVEEGKVTPVKIRYGNIHKTYESQRRGYTETIYFNMDVSIEGSMPISTSGTNK
jgi:hypothetical protein